MKHITLFFVLTFSIITSTLAMDHVILDIHEEVPPNSIESIKKTFEKTTSEICSSDNIINCCLCLATTGGTSMFFSNCNCCTSVACGLLLFIGASHAVRESCPWYQIIKKND